FVIEDVSGTIPFGPLALGAVPKIHIRVRQIGYSTDRALMKMLLFLFCASKLIGLKFHVAAARFDLVANFRSRRTWKIAVGSQYKKPVEIVARNQNPHVSDAGQNCEPFDFHRQNKK